MINFEDEIKKFQRSLEIEETVDEIYHSDALDLTELISRLVEDNDKRTAADRKRRS